MNRAKMDLIKLNQINSRIQALQFEKVGPLGLERSLETIAEIINDEYDEQFSADDIEEILNGNS